MTVSLTGRIVEAARRPEDPDAAALAAHTEDDLEDIMRALGHEDRWGVVQTLTEAGHDLAAAAEGIAELVDDEERDARHPCRREWLWR